jgi:hypothetical protein
MGLHQGGLKRAVRPVDPRCLAPTRAVRLVELANGKLYGGRKKEGAILRVKKNIKK